MTDEIPPGWRATEYQDARGNQILQMRDGKWLWCRMGEIVDWHNTYDTPAAAIRALEESENV